jgi:hypothetical protein
MNGNSVGNSLIRPDLHPALTCPCPSYHLPSIADWYRLYVADCRYGQQFGSVGKNQKTTHVQKLVIERETRQERNKTDKAGRDVYMAEYCRSIESSILTRSARVHNIFRNRCVPLKQLVNGIIPSSSQLCSSGNCQTSG